MGEYRRIASLVALLAVGTVACADEEPLWLNSMGLRQVPVDTTVPGELPEGRYLAFGLRLPRDLRMVKRTPNTLLVSGRMSFEHAANYFRDRVDGGKVVTGPTKTHFRQVTVLEAPDRTVDIEVARVFQGVRIAITDRTRKKAKKEADLTERERWGRLGLTPDGKVLEKYAQ